MYWIESITDPKILKLGIRMALYREKKPEKWPFLVKEANASDKATQIEQATDQARKNYERAIKYWQQSRIAYLKEPEFKVGETWYFIKTGKSVRCTGTLDEGKTFIYQSIKGTGTIAKNEVESLFSHYYPGQEWDGEVKYVRAHCPECNEILDRQVKDWNACHECGEAHPDSDIKWQEVEEPEELLKTERYGKPRYWKNTRYTQFQADKKSGDVLAEINT